jgi:hypothetical protein
VMACDDVAQVWREVKVGGNGREQAVLELHASSIGSLRERVQRRASRYRSGRRHLAGRRLFSLTAGSRFNR